MDESTGVILQSVLRHLSAPLTLCVLCVPRKPCPHPSEPLVFQLKASPANCCPTDFMSLLLWKLVLTWFWCGPLSSNTYAALNSLSFPGASSGVKNIHYIQYNRDWPENATHHSFNIRDSALIMLYNLFVVGLNLVGFALFFFPRHPRKWHAVQRDTLEWARNRTLASDY